MTKKNTSTSHNSPAPIGRGQLLRFFSRHPQPVTLHQLTKAFAVPKEHGQLLALLEKLQSQGLLLPAGNQAWRLPTPGADTPPDTFEVEVLSHTPEGNPVCAAVNPAVQKQLATFAKGEGASVLMMLDGAKKLQKGDVVHAQFSLVRPGVLLGSVLPSSATKKLEHAGKKAEKKSEAKAETKTDLLVGVLKELSAHSGRFVALHPELGAVPFVVKQPPAHLKDGMVVLAKPTVYKHSDGGYGSFTPVVVQKVLGNSTVGLESTISILSKGLPYEFPAEVVAESEALPAFAGKKDMQDREDLRHLPMVTIDGADARDFDDAVWAEKTPSGFHIVVAIADVAHYIAEGSALDKEALNRGNSTYFPDKVVPMLPERLCNDLCSLRPHEDRPVLAVHMDITHAGQLHKHRFVRGVIHSHARLTYEQVETAIAGQHDNVSEKLWLSTIQPLYEAYKVLLHARNKRGALDLDVPETQVIFNDEGQAVDIHIRERYHSHRLIEEMMVLANVAAALALSTKGAPALYRVHPEPSTEKLQNLESVLKSHNLRLGGGNVTQHRLQNLIDKVRSFREAPALMQSILRSQSQAKYDPENIGHFGLGLTHYAHFTSPIRRYSDLVVHRNLVRHLNLAGNGGTKKDAKHLQAVADHLNLTERRSQHAEWDARDRMVASIFNHSLGREFSAVVMSVQKFGLFVSIGGGLAEGLVPVRTMANDHYLYNSQKQTLFGKRTHREFRVGSTLNVRLIEADTVFARLTFEPVDLQQKPTGGKKGHRYAGGDKQKQPHTNQHDGRHKSPHKNRSQSSASSLHNSHKSSGNTDKNNTPPARPTAEGGKKQHRSSIMQTKGKTSTGVTKQANDFGNKKQQPFKKRVLPSEAREWPTTDDTMLRRPTRKVRKP